MKQKFKGTTVKISPERYSISNEITIAVDNKIDIVLDSTILNDAVSNYQLESISMQNIKDNSLYLSLSKLNKCNPDILNALFFEIQKDNFKRLESLSDSGDCDAQHKLAIVYSEGIGVEKCLEKSIYWHQKSASGGNKASQIILGRF